MRFDLASKVDASPFHRALSTEARRRAEPPPPELDIDPETGMVRGRFVADLVLHDYVGSRINDAFGGMLDGGLIFVVGSAGHGKSTASAELAGWAVRYWQARHRLEHGAPPYIAWLDADQGRDDLVKRNFEAAQLANVFEQDVRLLPRDRLWTFDEAIAFIPPRMRILVIDSLERWGGGPNDQDGQMAVLLKTKTHQAKLKIVIVGANKKGEVSGLSALERANDATIFARKWKKEGRDVFELDTGKCRWPPCTTALQRRTAAAGIAEREEAIEQHDRVRRGDGDDDDLETDPPKTLAELAARMNAVPKKSEAPKTSFLRYFDTPFLVEAALWDPIRIGRFHAELMDLGVPDRVIVDWDKARSEMSKRIAQRRKAARDEEDEETDA